MDKNNPLQSMTIPAPVRRKDVGLMSRSTSSLDKLHLHQNINAENKEKKTFTKAKLETLLETLQSAIANGDIQRAQTIATLLANCKAQVCIENHSLNNEEDKTFRLRVKIEYRDKSAGIVVLNVNPKCKIKKLKKEILFKYKIPTKLQRWIVGKRLSLDEDTLEMLGVTKDNYTVYLYVMTAKFADAGVASSFRLDPASQDIESGFVFVQSEGLPQLPQHGADRIADIREEEEENEEVQMHSLEDNGAYPDGGAQANILSQPVNAEPEPKKKKWSCRLCTFENSPENVKCNACSSDGPNAIPIAELGQIPPIFIPDIPEELRWTCNTCTLKNLPLRPGCELCAANRPEDFVVPLDYVPTPEELEFVQRTEDSERNAREKHNLERLLNLQYLEQIDDQDVVANSDEFTCSICYCDCEVGEGVVLRDCLHVFCRDCLNGHIKACQDPIVPCPHMEDEFSCNSVLQDREIRALVDNDTYRKHLQTSLTVAESRIPNSYHCKTADCQGWCVYEDDVNTFDCDLCGKKNCLTCAAIHENQNCREYQDELRIRAANDDAAAQSQQALEQMIQSGNAMRCPGCRIIVQKKDGCDWIRCSVCRMEICWVTRGPRWGSRGEGDITGGCQCGVGFRKCHPNCGNCH